MIVQLFNPYSGQAFFTISFPRGGVFKDYLNIKKKNQIKSESPEDSL